MKKSFIVLLSGFTSPHIYKRWLVLPQKNIIKFFIFNILLVGFINGAIFSIKELPKIISSYQEYQQQLISDFPEDLIISWQDEKLSLLPTEQYQNIDLNLKDINQLQLTENLYIYYKANDLEDTEKQTLLENDETVFLINNQKIYFKNEDQTVTSKDLKELIHSEDFTITKTDLPFLETAVNQQLTTWQPKIQAIVPFLTAVINLVSTLIASLFFASFLWLLLKISPLTVKKWNFAWRLTLAVLVTVSYLELLTQLIYPNSFTNIKELAFWLITGYILLSWKFPKFKIQSN